MPLVAREESLAAVLARSHKDHVCSLCSGLTASAGFLPSDAIDQALSSLALLTSGSDGWLSQAKESRGILSAFYGSQIGQSI